MNFKFTYFVSISGVQIETATFFVKTSSDRYTFKRSTPGVNVTGPRQYAVSQYVWYAKKNLTAQGLGVPNLHLQRWRLNMSDKHTKNNNFFLIFKNLNISKNNWLVRRNYRFNVFYRYNNFDKLHTFKCISWKILTCVCERNKKFRDLQSKTVILL